MNEAIRVASPTPLRPKLKGVLLFDAATCAAMGALLLALTAPLAALLGLPSALVWWAGLLLLPCALLMLVAALREPPSKALVGLIVAGNLGWALASVVVIAITPTLNAAGLLFVLAQALVVAVLAVLEWRGLASS